MVDVFVRTGGHEGTPELGFELEDLRELDEALVGRRVEFDEELRHLGLPTLVDLLADIPASASSRTGSRSSRSGAVVVEEQRVVVPARVV